MNNKKLISLLTQHHFNTNIISVEYVTDMSNIVFNKGAPSKIYTIFDYSGTYAHHIAMCYYIIGCYDLAEKYYLDAVAKMNYAALYDLGCYYHVNKEYRKMKYYYRQAILYESNSAAMNNLGFYYHKVKRNFNKALCYYDMAVSLDNPCAMNNLAYYYHYVEKKYNKALYYYTLAYKFGIKTCKRQINKILESFDI